jgi:hypothetical protein
MCQVELV